MPIIPISGLAHIGIRVHDLARSEKFYALLGFTKTAGPTRLGPSITAIFIRDPDRNVVELDQHDG